MLEKVHIFLDRVEDKDSSDIPHAYLETAIFVMLRDLKAQATVSIKREQTEGAGQPQQSSLHPEVAPRPTASPAPFQGPGPGFLPISVRRVNRQGIIRSKLCFLSHFTATPAPPPSHERPRPE